MDWINLAQDRDQSRALVTTVMKLQVPYNVGKFLSSCTSGRLVYLVSSFKIFLFLLHS
jgi:hypothetical protein